MGFHPEKKLIVGSASSTDGRPVEPMTPAERKLYEEIAERLLEEHRETLKKLADE